MNEIKEAIEQLQEKKENIDKQIAMLQNFEHTDLTEENYHEFCRTLLRNSELLGQALGQMFGVKYLRRNLNSFDYRLPNGWRMMVPSTTENCIFIAIEDYVGENFENSAFARKNLDVQRQAEREIEFLTDKFLNADKNGKADYVAIGFQMKNPIIKRIVENIGYDITNLWEHYEKKYANRVKALKKKIDDLQESYETEKSAWNVAFEKQEKYLEEYCGILLHWTSKVNVFQDGVMSRNFAPSHYRTIERKVFKIEKYAEKTTYFHGLTDGAS